MTRGTRSRYGQSGMWSRAVLFWSLGLASPLPLRLTHTVELPAHLAEGGFDHAAVHSPSGQLFVAHTANDSVDVVDIRERQYLRSIPGFPGVAGVLVSEEAHLLITSNRGATTVSVVPLDDESAGRSISVGGRPNGLALHPRRELLLAANIDRPGRPGVYTASIVDLKRSVVLADIALPGRPRWAVFDPFTDRFYVNIRDPPQIVAVGAKEPTRIAASFPVPFAGPHGLDLDDDRRRLFCACDARKLVRLDLRTERVTEAGSLSGAPDVTLLNPRRGRVYVAHSDPGGIDVVDADRGELLESISTEPGSGTMAFEPSTGELFVLLQESHSVGVYVDEEGPGP